MRKALILLAHGSRDPAWALPLQRVLAAVRVLRPDQRVVLAFLEFIEPDLPECARSLLAEGFERIVVVPMLMAQGGHLKHGIARTIDELRRERPGAHFELSGAIGEAEEVVRVMAAHVLSIADAPMS